MTYQHRPEYEAPDEVRCEAVVPAHPSANFAWMRTSHRCPRRACQMVGTRQLCWQHARMNPWPPRPPVNHEENHEMTRVEATVTMIRSIVELSHNTPDDAEADKAALIAADLLEWLSERTGGDLGMMSVACGAAQGATMSMKTRSKPEMELGLRFHDDTIRFFWEMLVRATGGQVPPAREK